MCWDCLGSFLLPVLLVLVAVTSDVEDVLCLNKTQHIKEKLKFLVKGLTLVALQPLKFHVGGQMRQFQFPSDLRGPSP